jgi:hypothetical protein
MLAGGKNAGSVELMLAASLRAGAGCPALAGSAWAACHVATQTLSASSGPFSRSMPATVRAGMVRRKKTHGGETVACRSDAYSLCVAPSERSRWSPAH